MKTIEIKKEKPKIIGAVFELRWPTTDPDTILKVGVTLFTVALILRIPNWRQRGIKMLYEYCKREYKDGIPRYAKRTIEKRSKRVKIAKYAPETGSELEEYMKMGVLPFEKVQYVEGYLNWKNKLVITEVELKPRNTYK